MKQLIVSYRAPPENMVGLQATWHYTGVENPISNADRIYGTKAPNEKVLRIVAGRIFDSGIPLGGLCGHIINLQTHYYNVSSVLDEGIIMTYSNLRDAFRVQERGASSHPELFATPKVWGVPEQIFTIITKNVESVERTINRFGLPLAELAVETEQIMLPSC